MPHPTQLVHLRKEEPTAVVVYGRSLSPPCPARAAGRESRRSWSSASV